jgi:hypothetical protein
VVGPGQDGGGARWDLPPTRDYLWCGTTRANVPQLAGGTTVEVPLEVGAPHLPHFGSGYQHGLLVRVFHAMLLVGALCAGFRWGEGSLA